MLKINYLVSIAIAILLLITCSQNNKFTGKLVSQAYGDSTVFIDTTFVIDFEADIGEISGFGCHVVYDSNQIRYLSSQKYGHFDHENIALANGEQGRLIIGFNQFDCDSSLKDTTITVFSIEMQVKLTASEGISPIHFENKEVKLCDENISSTWHGLNLFIKRINQFIMRMKLR